MGVAILHSVIEVRVGVQDISQAINFYRNVFGFEVLESHVDHALVGVAHSPLGRIRLLQRSGLERKQPKDRKSTRLNSSHSSLSRMPSSA